MMPYKNTGALKKSKSEQVSTAKEDLDFYNKLLASSNEVKTALSMLTERRKITLDTIKESCVVELQRFIDARGSINKETGTVCLVPSSVPEQNIPSTIHNINTTNTLITAIANAHSIQDIINSLHMAPDGLSDDLEAVLDKCAVITNLFQENGETPSM